MRKTPAAFVSIRTKIVIFVCAIITASYLFMLYRTSVFDGQMILRQAEQQARMLHKQIVLTRQWASDHNGLFILEQAGVSPNPYLDLPQVTDGTGRTYYLRNPAMITRELSAYAVRDGLGFFRVTSLAPVNPGNAPDEFETKALKAFAAGDKEKIDITDSEMGRLVRFMAPLRVSRSCLGCHGQHGYKEGDIRGGLSISIPIKWADQLIQSNIRNLAVIGFLSIVIVTVVLFLMFESLIVQRVSKLSHAMDHFPDSLPEPTRLPSVFRDEIDILNDNFALFCERLKTSQEELLQAKNKAHLAEKMASLGILTAGIAHEVNNPLGGMLNCVKSMRENSGDTSMIERYLPLLDKGLRRIETVMRQLLNFGRVEPLQTRLVELQPLFSECIELLSYKLKRIRLVTDLQVSGPHLLDAEALKQIIINIGLNAIQAMADGGELAISFREDGETLELRFGDTGCGISEENLVHIFDPFFTTKGVGEGTGLGLAVTYSLVQRMGGSIEVQSTVNVGTTIIITIPLNGEAPVNGRKALERDGMAAGQPTIENN